MRFRPPLRVSVTRHEEKERSLKDFLLQHISAVPSGGGSAHAADLLIVARSLESPVIKAIGSLTEEIAAARLSVRLILAHLERELQPRDWAFAHEIRWAKHPRLIEAHEQMVIGPETCWIGDCMRRDPAKCDAYESFVEGCGEAAGCATVSFERLWHASQPLVSRMMRGGGFVGPGISSRAPGSQTTAGTRH
jgi:hypothetical protein